MLEPLYLDTARLGRMSPMACRASIEFARFSSEHGCTLYFSEFLQEGFPAWSRSLQERYPGLASWQGVGELGQRLKRLAQARDDSQIALASRSATLMRFAARLLSGPCRNVLLTDLTWPAYERTLERERKTAKCRMTRVKLRRSILQDRFPEEQVIDRIVQCYVERDCDGLFLPLVDNMGVNLPVRTIVERIRDVAELRFVVIDGAQAIGQVPLDLAGDYCDLFLAGCHKWLRAFTPLGIGYFGHPHSVEYIQHSLARWLRSGDIDDPLLAFTRELLSGDAQPFGETVSVSPLITCDAATQDALATPNDPTGVFDSRQRVIDFARLQGWRCVSPPYEMQSKIVLFDHGDRRIAECSPEELRRQFCAKGVALTAYSGGMLRVSLPESAMSQAQSATLQAAFANPGRG